MFTSKKQQLDKSRLGRLLVNRGYITEKQLEDALVLQRERGEKLGQLLIDQGMITEKDLSRTLKHQERYRYAAAIVAAVVSPLQPMVALASGSVAAMPENRTGTSEMVKFAKSKGLQPLQDEEMGGVSAQGLVEDVQWLANTIQDARDGKDQSTENSDEIGQVKMLAHIALPITNFLDSDVKVEGVRYDTSQMASINPDGSVNLAFPSHIDRISMENIRPQGAAANAPTFGSLYFTDINMQMDVTVRTRF